MDSTVSFVITSDSINPSVFYGKNRSYLSELSDPLPAVEVPLPNYLSDPLLGPSRIWKIFKKQQEALDFISDKQLEGHLLPFAYESINYERLFLVAHPDVFWFRDCQKPASLRNTYEIIAEKRICKLYFDLEFEKYLNKESDGDEMVRTFVRIVLYYIQKIFGVKYKMDSVLILDSSTDEKYSSHLIFQTSIVFRNNFHAGNFVKFICNELFKIQNLTTDEEQFNFDLFKETTINIYSVQDLFVINKKNVKVLFCDLAVYTRNRLFRLYKSSKQKKNVPLVVSHINKYKLKDIPLSDSIQYERYIFLMSLITYFIKQPEDDGNIKEFEKVSLNPNYCDEVNLRKLKKLHTGKVSPTKISPYPELDKFILTRVRPYGKIFRNIHFPTTNVTVYDIKGFRYCGNIARWHKSQNIKLIADVNRGVYYQKCHDLECADYKSSEWPIPPEVLFKIRNDEEEDLFFQNNCIDLGEEVKTEGSYANTNSHSSDAGHANINEGKGERNENINGIDNEFTNSDEYAITNKTIPSKKTDNDCITKRSTERIGSETNLSNDSDLEIITEYSKRTNFRFIEEKNESLNEFISIDSSKKSNTPFIVDHFVHNTFSEAEEETKNKIRNMNNECNGYDKLELAKQPNSCIDAGEKYIQTEREINNCISNETKWISKSNTMDFENCSKVETKNKIRNMNNECNGYDKLELAKQPNSCIDAGKKYVQTEREINNCISNKTKWISKSNTMDFENCSKVEFTNIGKNIDKQRSKNGQSIIEDIGTKPDLHTSENQIEPNQNTFVGLLDLDKELKKTDETRTNQIQKEPCLPNKQIVELKDLQNNNTSLDTQIYNLDNAHTFVEFKDDCSDQNNPNKTQNQYHIISIENMKEIPGYHTIEKQNDNIELSDLINKGPNLIQLKKEKNRNEKFLKSKSPDLMYHSASSGSYDPINESSDDKMSKEKPNYNKDLRITEPVIKKIKF